MKIDKTIDVTLLKSTWINFITFENQRANLIYNKLKKHLKLRVKWIFSNFIFNLQ